MVYHLAAGLFYVEHLKWSTEGFLIGHTSLICAMCFLPDILVQPQLLFPEIYPLLLYYWYPLTYGYLQSKIPLQWLTACLPLWPPFRPMGNSSPCHVNAVCTFCLSLVSLVFLLLLNQHSTFRFCWEAGICQGLRKRAKHTNFLINKFSNFTFFSEMADPALPVWFDCLASIEPGCEVLQLSEAQ